MANASASFDFLFITGKLCARFGTATFGEIHLFSYLGCLLSLFRGQPAADWGYSFAGLDSGSPFSAELQAACPDLELAGLILGEAGSIAITPEGEKELEFLSGLQHFGPRKSYLTTALESLLSFPVGMVRNALSMEPGLRPALKVGGSRPLLEETALGQLHEHFEALHSALGECHDLLVPSSLWLTYLLELAKEHDADVMRHSKT
jgi:hypothetical protein